MVSHWTGDLGGAEVQVKYIMEYLQKYTNHEICFICRKATLTHENGIKIHKTTSNKFLSRHFKSVDYFSINKLLKNINPDVIYTRVSTAFVGIAAKYAKKNNKKLIYHIAHKNDVTPYKAKKINQLSKLIERIIYLYGLKSADVIIGQATYQDISLQKNYKRKCTDIIPNFHPKPTEKIEKEISVRVLWIANIKSAKKPEAFLELVKGLNELVNVHFHMIGKIQDKKYENFENEYSDIKNFTYHGHLPLELANKHLSQSHIFINTSSLDGEGFPNTLIQAWMRKVPVVTLDINPDEIITRNGLGYHSKTITQMKKDVRTLILDRELRNNIGERAQTFAFNNYSLEKNCSKIVDLMES